MWRILLVVGMGLAIAVALDADSSSTSEVGEAQVTLGNKYAHCKPSCGPHMECVCSPRGCFPGVCCWCAPK